MSPLIVAPRCLPSVLLDHCVVVRGLAAQATRTRAARCRRRSAQVRHQPGAGDSQERGNDDTEVTKGRHGRSRGSRDHGHRLHGSRPGIGGHRSRGGRPPGDAARAIDAAGAAGITAEARDGDALRRSASGVGNLNTGTPRGKNDRVRVGHITSTFVATVLLQMEAAKNLSLDDTVERHLPSLVTGNGNDGLRTPFPGKSSGPLRKQSRATAMDSGRDRTCPPARRQ
jgi:hypothetical protein